MVLKTFLKLSSNENPFGPSGGAKTMIARPHPAPLSSTDHASLRKAITNVWSLPILPDHLRQWVR
jgi:histidinol-phosphate/aromatic aminotransferase/cobyric acid decarboxylase-like protein